MTKIKNKQACCTCGGDGRGWENETCPDCAGTGTIDMATFEEVDIQKELKVVGFMTALKAFMFERKTIICEWNEITRYEYDHATSGLQYLECCGQAISAEEILCGSWFIEDEAEEAY